MFNSMGAVHSAFRLHKTTYELPADTSAIEEYIETTSVFITDYTEETDFDEVIADEDKIEELLSAD